MRDRERYLDLDGARLRVRESGAGPAVVLVHGWALDAQMWEPQIADLARDYHLITYDRRGFGLSSGEPGIDADIADLRSLLDVLDIQRACFLGMSQGARVVLHFAQRHRKLASCLVLDGPPAIADVDTHASSEIPMDRYRDILRRFGLEAFRREWQQHALMQLQTQDPTMRAILRTIIERYPGKDLLSTQAKVSPRIEWRSLDIPMFVINGEQDTDSRLAAATCIVELSADACHAIVPDAGHLPNLDNPTYYNAALRSFLHQHAATERAST